MILRQILDATARRVAALPATDDLRRRVQDAPPPRDFAAALKRNGLQVIAEIKRRSPSAGSLAPNLDVRAQAAAYVAGGAAAVSVLTEPHFFAGSLDDLRGVRAAVDVPVLRKDFVIDGRQIWQARAAGADAVLLIVAAVEARLAELLDTAGEAEIAGVVEVHTEAEATQAVEAGAGIVGVNNRDLTTFVTDLTVAERIAGVLPEDTVRIAESGVSSREGAARMEAAGYHAILVGEALMRAGDPASLLHELRGGS